MRTTAIAITLAFALACGGQITAPNPATGDCGTLDLGDGHVVTLACPGAPERTSGPTANVPTGPVPPMVDHRADGTEGPVRDQGPVGDCTAYAIAGAVDHALAVALGHPTSPVSVSQIWSHYAKGNTGDAKNGNVGETLTSEDVWPVDEAAMCSYYPCARGHLCQKSLHVSCGQPAAADLVAKAEAHPLAKVVDISRVRFDAASLEEVIAHGADVWINFHITDAIKHVLQKPFGSTVPDYRPKGNGAHSVILVGYRLDQDQPYFLIHNSWSERWGDKGYGWLANDTLQANCEVAQIVNAVPVGSAPPAPEPQPVKEEPRRGRRHG